MIAACPFQTRQGTQVFVRHLGNALAAAGHNVELVCFRQGDIRQDVSFRVTRASSPDVGSRSGPSWLRPIADLALLATTARILRRRRPTIVHCHGFEALAVGLCLRGLVGHRLPVVYHAHSALAAELPTYFTGSMHRKFGALVGRSYDRLLPQRADAVIVFNDAQAEYYRGCGVDGSNLAVIPLGLGEDELGCSRGVKDYYNHLFGGRSVVVYAGNPDGYQNLDLLWRAFSLLRVRRPDVLLAVVSHHSQVAFFSGGVPAGVVMVDGSDAEAIGGVLANSTIAVCPRELRAGVPVKILNYFRAGLPVVAVASAARGLVDASVGRCAENNPADFAAAMDSLLSAVAVSEVRADYSISLRARASRYTLRHQVDVYGRLYSSLTVHSNADCA